MESEWKTYHFDATCLRCQLKKAVKGQNAFYVTHVSPISRLETMEYIYPKLSDVTVYCQSKQAVMNDSDYIKTEDRDVRIFMQLKQCCVIIRHFDDV